jgi:hypothetical protein
MAKPIIYSDLLNKYNDKYQDDECGGWTNKKAPGRCQAAKEYRQQVRDFVKSAIEEEEKSIPAEQDLMKSRIEQKEYKNVYPLVNYDFDYKTSVKKELNPFQLGITNEPTFGNLVDGTVKLKNYIDYMVTNPYPNNNTIAGISDIVTENKNKVAIVKQKQLEDDKLPYKLFKKDFPECLYPTKGKHASSYFVRAGTCPTKINNKDICFNKGYQWVPETPPRSDFKNYVKTENPDNNKNIPAPDTPLPPPEPEKGSCFKPRFVYIDNSPKGVFGLDGAIPTMLNEINSVNPGKIANIMAGYNIGGSGITPCSIEEFSIKQTQINYSVILLIGTILVVLYTCSKK